MRYIETGKNTALSFAEMDEMNREFAESNHLYDTTKGGRTEAITQIVTELGNDALTDRKKVNLRDVKEVKRIAAEYIASCKRTPLLPSKSGLSRSLGYSRQGIWLFMRNNPDSETAEFLSMLFDMFSECYDVAALGGNIHPIYAIFTQKAQYQLRDNTPIEEIGNDEKEMGIAEKARLQGYEGTDDEVISKYWSDHYGFLMLDEEG